VPAVVQVRDIDGVADLVGVGHQKAGVVLLVAGADEQVDASGSGVGQSGVALLGWVELDGEEQRRHGVAERGDDPSPADLLPTGSSVAASTGDGHG
jgi:hypothetical protein